MLARTIALRLIRGADNAPRPPLRSLDALHSYLQLAFASTKRNVSANTSFFPVFRTLEFFISFLFFFFHSSIHFITTSKKKKANELRVGSVIETEAAAGGAGGAARTGGGLAQITKYLYTQGSGRQLGVVQATLRCLRTGNRTEARWRPGDSVLEARLDEEAATILYRERKGTGSDGEDVVVVLMSDDTFEQFSLPSSMLGSAGPFLADGAGVVVSRAPGELGGDALSVAPREPTAEVVVVAAPPPRTGAQSSYQKVVVSSSNSGGSSDSKNATSATTNTAEVSVPAHVKEGDRIVVDLRDASFVRRL